MAIAERFADLDGRLDALAQALDNVRWAAVQAQPASGAGHALIDHYGAVADDCYALLAEARATLADENISPGRALVACQGRHNQLILRFYHDGVAHRWREALGTLRRRGGEWATWVKGLDDALDRCPGPLYDAGEALLACWQAFVEWPPGTAVAVATTNIGPMIRSDSRRADGGAGRHAAHGGGA